MIYNQIVTWTVFAILTMYDVTPACEDTNSKLLDVVSVADVDDEDRVGNSLLQNWELRFGHEA